LPDIIEKPVPRAAPGSGRHKPSLPPCRARLTSPGAAAGSGVTFWDRGKCRDLIGSLRNEGIFTPPDLHGTLLMPGYIGGVNWGGIAFDEQRQRVIAAVNQLPMRVTLLPADEFDAQARSGGYPHAELAARRRTYGMRRQPLLSPWGLPCTAPWGTLSVSTCGVIASLAGTAQFERGLIPFVRRGLRYLTCRSIATAGDWCLSARRSTATCVPRYRDRAELKYKLPAGGQATPMTYRRGPSAAVMVIAPAVTGRSGPRAATT
jgi:quinoprotein glucose dehydrogenase